MKLSKNMAKTAAIIIAFLMASVMLTATSVQAQAYTEGGPPGGGYEGPTTIPAGETADYVIEPMAFISVTPHVIGLGQIALVNVWITPPSGEGKYMAHYVVTITKPDGSNETVNLRSYVADGTSWFLYYPEAIGEYKFQFKFLGEWFPAGYYRNGNYSTTRTGYFANAIYNPSIYAKPATSQVVTLIVQKDIVPSWHSPLPADYWQRPIEPNNREWNVIAGNYPWNQANIAGVTSNAWHDNYYGPYIPSVETPHIVWKRVGALAGIIGGETGQFSLVSSPGTPSVIFMGRCYQTRYEVIDGVPTSCAVCYDLRTGQVYYAIPTSKGGVTPTHIAYRRGTGTAVPGEVADVGYSVELSTISGNRLYKITPLTGAVSANITLPSWGTGGVAELFYRDGYYYSFRAVASRTATPAPNITVTTGYDGFLIKWDSWGTSTNFASRVVSNVSVYLPMSYRTPYQTSTYGNIGGAIDYESMISVNQNRFVYAGFYGYTLNATDLKTGKSLWNYTSPLNDMQTAYRPTNAWCRHGRYIAELERGIIQAWELQTGKVLWTTELPDFYPWGEFWMYDEAAYEDLIYAVGYTGVWALNETTGKVVWHYVDPAPPFETPYHYNYTSCYSVQEIRVIGDKIYVSNNEHTPSQPHTRGWGLICLDAKTGKFQWKISGTRLQAGAAAEGYLTAASNYDGTMVVFGKGKSQTTVTAPDVVVPKGTGVVIKGSVLDMSPAQPGTPCVAKESMATWMDYLHFQMPIDGYYHNVTIKGVPVKLTAIREDGTYIDIGTVTTDGYTGSFGLAWTPPEEGTYKIVASFEGDESYGSSSAATYITVGPAPPEPETPEIPTPTDYTPMFTALAIAIIVIAILVVYILYTVRKLARK